MPPARALAIASALSSLATVLGAQDALPALIDRSAPCDVDGDGAAELVSLDRLFGAGRSGDPAVAILIEPRLLDLDTDGALRARLRRFADDVAAEGFRAEVIAVALQHGERHQDGLTLLGLRRFLVAWHREGPPLSGAVLVGHFPDAFLVRTCNWRKHGKITVGDTAFDEAVPYLRRVPEIVAPRCDLMLADLDGDWEGRYVEKETTLASVVAAFPDGVPPTGGTAAAVERGEVRLRDFFLVEDGTVTVAPDGASITIDDAARDLECTSADLALGNSIARPEIAVSRIDARGVAWSPRRDLDGRSLRDESGRPQTIEMREGEQAPDPTADLWVPDPSLELRLVVELFDRDHRYRTEGAGDAFRPASIACGLPSGFAELRHAADDWASTEADGYDVRRDASLVDFIHWLQRPAVLRTVRAHSNERITVFAKSPPDALAAAIGGPPLAWQREDRRLVPSLDAVTRDSCADFFLLRTLWQNQALPTTPYLMIHTGCEATAPPGATTLRYDEPRYGAFANAESLLFLTPCVAMVGRAKVFYDEPRGFCDVLRSGGTFGEAWRHYFEVESHAPSWAEVGGDIGRKRSYFWSLLGDWTLRLQR